MSPQTHSRGTPSFAALSQEEQRQVAERLLRIEQSGWKPFWCERPDCDGMPHLLEETDPDTGEVYNLYADINATSGPNGEAVGDIERDEDGTLIGRPLFDPHWSHNHARADQRLPPWADPWILFIMSGRGTGKTTTGTEFVTLCARRGLDGAIIGRRGTELENTHVKTIIARAHPEFMPEYFASKDILVWPNGATTFLFSAERPENIRSVNLSYAWVDEAAFMDEIETAWMNLRLATRIETPGNPIHILITSTPTSTPWVMKMEDDEEVEIRRVSTYANRANLSADFLAALEREYEGTRMGRQELHGEVLRDVEGALWNDDLFRHERAKDAAEFDAWLGSMDDRVIAVDPAGSKGARSDATGIIGVGVQHFDEDGNYLPASNFTVMLDATLKGSPAEWAERAYKAARLMQASRIIVEKNFGGDMVKQTLLDWAKLHPKEACDENGEQYQIVLEHAVVGKETRAEPTVAKYEQGRVVHLTSPVAWGDLSMLEKEQVHWVPKSRGGKFPSPNRIDALVWAVRNLESKQRYQVSLAGNAVTQRLKKPVARVRSLAGV